MSPNDADGTPNSVDPDQTAPLGAVWSGSALFAQAYLSENLGSLRVALDCLLQLEQVNTESDDSGVDPWHPLALALRSVRCRSASQTLLAKQSPILFLVRFSFWWGNTTISFWWGNAAIYSKDSGGILRGFSVSYSVSSGNLGSAPFGFGLQPSCVE